MRFMNGSLERRLRSSSLQAETPSACPLTHACVVEVTSANFHAIVVDNSKVAERTKIGKISVLAHTIV